MVIVLFVVLSISTFCCADEFPYRKHYPDVPVLNLDEARNSYENEEAILVDIRSKMEFETIHIKNAINIDFSVLSYLATIEKLGKENPGKKIIVYDNGINSLKSYISVQDAAAEGIENVYAYDGGIQAWAEMYPQDILLMGDQLHDPASQLIPYDKFVNILLDSDSFMQKISESPDAKVIDARDPIERVEKIDGLEKALPVPFDKLVQNIINKGHMKNDKLFIFDQVGGQVRWIMYYMEKNGYKNYFFLKGGATAILNEQKYRKG